MNQIVVYENGIVTKWRADIDNNIPIYLDWTTFNQLLATIKKQTPTSVKSLPCSCHYWEGHREEDGPLPGKNSEQFRVLSPISSNISLN